MEFPFVNGGKKPSVIGAGAALVDILVSVEESFLNKHNVVKGGMELVSFDRTEELLSDASSEKSVVAGGSACNTIMGMGRMGCDSSFVGSVQDDELGEIFKGSLKINSVKPRLFKGEEGTGRVISLITPDAERSMCTYLGASAEMKPQLFTDFDFGDAALIHVEGYMVFNEGLIRSVLESAKKAGLLISLDLSSFTVVDAQRSLVQELVKSYVNIVIANEEEAFSYTGLSDELEALHALAKDADCAVVKLGKRGSLVSSSGCVTKIEPYGDGVAVDTTGAGDLWASGFLYGLLNGESIEKAGARASRLGYEVCQVVGAQIPDSVWAKIK